MIDSPSSACRRSIVLGACLASLLAVFCSRETIATENDKTSNPIGRRIDDFTLKDFRGRDTSLSEFRDARLVVVAFLGTECPLAKLYTPRLAQLAGEFQPRGVAFIGIDANAQDSITEIAAHARRHDIPFPLLKDLGNRVADQMGAVRTPEVFVLDADRVVRYWGRIDDQYGIGYIREEPKRRDLATALEELLAGNPVSTPIAEAIGCHIGRVREPDESSEVTFSNQIAPILNRRCVECHRSGEIAPFALSDYDEVAGWAETIAEVVEQNRMPPWHADPAHGAFANDRRLSDEEKQLIYRWVAAGAPRGNADELPPPPQFIEGWQLPQPPDEVVYIRPQPFEVPAEGAIRYQYFTVDPGFEEDKWVKAVEVSPGNRAVVHHVLVFLKVGRQRFGQGEGYLAAFVPGMRAKPFPAGMAKFIPAGAKFYFQVHYTPIGSVQEDRSAIGLVFADPEEVEQVVLTGSAFRKTFFIPPRDGNYRIEAGTKSMPFDFSLLSMMPHMHLRGKSFRYELRGGDSDQGRVLLDVPRYDFNWQTNYRFAEPQKIPAGAQIHCTAHYDNSADNPANPDPEVTVRFGPQTWDEMMFGYFDYALPRGDFERYFQSGR